MMKPDLKCVADNTVKRWMKDGRPHREDGPAVIRGSGENRIEEFWFETRLMKELGYGHKYRYAHDEPNAYAAGETYLPDGIVDPGWYQPVPRGLEIKIGEKLALLKSWDEEAVKK